MSSVSRRTFLGFALSGVGVSLLAACAPSTPAPAPTTAATTAPLAPTVAPTAAAAAKPTAVAAAPTAAAAAPTAATTAGQTTFAGVQLPTRIPVQGPQPDLPSGSTDIPNGYFTFPKQLFTSVQETPGTGKDVTMMTELFQPLPNALDNNPGWQQINKLLNANMVMTIVPFADYGAKFATTVASGDIPELLFINFPFIPQLPDFLKAQCEDLTPFLSGDNIKDYPNLANIPTITWRTPIFNKAIWGVGIALPVFFWVLWVHQDMLDQVGGQLPKNGDDFKRILKDATRPDQGQYGLISEVGFNYAYDVTNGFWPALFGAPNTWQEQNGKFTKDWETEEFKAAVGFARDVYAMGVYDPNSDTYNVISGRGAFEQRRSLFRWDGLTTVTFDSGNKLTPPSTLKLVAPFSAESGGKAMYPFGSGAFSFMALRKNSDKNRIKELLRILNFFAAPFGSEEFVNIRYGVRGVEFDFDAKGNPLLTEKGIADAMPWGAPSGTPVANPPAVLFDPNSEDYPRVIQPTEKEMYAIGKPNPSIGLWSPTDASQGPVLWQKIGDGITDIIKARRPMSDFDQLVKDWRDGGGDQIKAEYEKDFAASKA
jgi:putative aldouronate transport system substrate-binding protein